MNNSERALELLDLLGGLDNIEEISNCTTRFRAQLQDLEKANIEQIKNLDGVIGVVPFGSQVQIVLGENAQEVADIFINKLNLNNGNK